MTHPFAAFLARLVNRFWPVLLLGTLALGALSFPRTTRLFNTISTDPADLLPPKNPNVQTLLSVRKILERGANVTIIFESDRPEKTLDYLESVVTELRKRPDVDEVIDRKAGYNFFNKHKLLFIDLEDLKTARDRIDRRIQKEKLGPLFVELDGDETLGFGDLEKKYKSKYSAGARSPWFRSDDDRLYAIYVFSKDPSNALTAASEFQESMEKFVRGLRPREADPTMKVYLSGVGKVFEYRALIRDLKVAGIISGIFIFLPLLLRFRNPITVLFIFLPLAVGIPISLAFTSLFIPKLNVTTSFLFAILGGLGIENGIHIFSRYTETRLAGKTSLEGLEDIYHHTGRAILTSVASVAITFLLLMINEFRGFSEFGIISGIGLWIIFGVYFTFFPSLILFGEKIGLFRHRGRVERPIPMPLDLHPKTVNRLLLLFFLFSVFSLAAPSFLKFEYDAEKIRADAPEIRIAREKKYQAVTRVNNPAAVPIESEAEAIALKQEIAAIQKRNGEGSSIDDTHSSFDLIPSDQYKKIEVIGQIRKLLSDKTIRLVKGDRKKDLDKFKEVLAQTEPVKKEEIPAPVKEIFFGKRAGPRQPGSDRQLFYIDALPTLRLDNGRNAMQFAGEVHEVKISQGTYHPSSDAVIYGLVLRTMFNDVWKVLLISVLSVSFFVYLDFRNLKKTSIVMFSILTGVLWLLGVMLLFRIRFNMYNMIIIPAVMGMSIDNAIHVTHRYEELGPGSLKKVLGTTGLAAGLASATNAAGFLGLLWSKHGGLFSIGLLSVLGVITCMVSTLIFLPVLLTFLEKKT